LDLQGDVNEEVLVDKSIRTAAKATYVRPTLIAYGDFSILTTSGSGLQTEIFGLPMAMNMMRRP
jgi:hypothetical protein